MIPSFEFATTKRIVCAPDAILSINQLCRQFNAKRPFIITDQGLVAAGLLSILTDALNDLEYGLFADVVQDPPEFIIENALREAQQHDADLVIGFGGGSSMDSAKLIAVLLHTQQPLEHLYGIDNIKTERLPLILIPTTAGTGSEVTPISIITTGETTKAGVVSPVLLPDIALLDAKLTLKLPSGVTAATGIDAMVHAIEAYTSKIKKNPMSDMLARQALELLSANIYQATFYPDDVQSRQNMLLGACLAGQAFANAPVAGVHALAYPLGGHFHIPHGLSNSLVLPHVLKFNRPVASDLFAELARVVLPEAEQLNDTDGLSHQFIDYLTHLIDKLALPVRLRDLKVAESDLSMLAKDAMLQTRLLVNNPREITKKDALNIYNEAF